jgi:hypothetical protein
VTLPGLLPPAELHLFARLDFPVRIHHHHGHWQRGGGPRDPGSRVAPHTCRYRYRYRFQDAVGIKGPLRLWLQ